MMIATVEQSHSKASVAKCLGGVESAESPSHNDDVGFDAQEATVVVADP
jgi:hypothetical protein